jgi:hypothetical protein
MTLTSNFSGRTFMGILTLEKKKDRVLGILAFVV